VEGEFFPGGLNPPPIADKYNYSGKGETHFFMSNFGHCVNNAGKCWFATAIGPADALPKELSMVTGLEFSMDDMQEIGSRTAALRMAFNIREGFISKDITMPGRVLGDPPLESGATEGVTVDNVQEINDYLKAAGWDTPNGCPSEETLKGLGLDFVIGKV
jgi:aldehyde:ferredoxin oxidoreductase